MARRRYGEVTSGSGKSHQGRRITMAQPVSSILGDVVKSSRSIAHSDDFEGHKLIQTNSWQLILLDLNIWYWCPASRDQIKPLLVQPQISCKAAGKQQQARSRRQATAGTASSSMEQQAAGKQQGSSRQAAGKQQASSRQAAGKQQASSNQRLPPWKNDQIYFLKINAIKKRTFSSRTAPKQWNRSITKSCGDAKIELFPGARPPDTTFTSWYDLTLALVHGISPKTWVPFRKNTRITEMCVSPSPQIWDNWCDPSANCLSICLGLSRINQQVDTKQEFN